ncbi:hypothetical protein [Empedobacter falsenii]|uniref:hypothetical protein n=1 Tax=Empedobacter falsenii TaxID=343874 RepID=UPI003A7FC3DC
MANIVQKIDFDLSSFQEISKELFSALSLLENISLEIDTHYFLGGSFLNTTGNWKEYELITSKTDFRHFISKDYPLDEKRLIELAKNKSEELFNMFKFKLQNLH